MEAFEISGKAFYVWVKRAMMHIWKWHDNMVGTLVTFIHLTW